jgi:hypothetical protein
MGKLSGGSVGPIWDSTGPIGREQRLRHQFLDVDGFVEQVIIARDEYPADLR